MVQFAGGVTAVQLKPMALEEEAVAVRLVGAEGTALQDVLARVYVCACAPADAPSASTALTT